VVRGIAYDFSDLLMADAFIQAVETGAVPSDAALSCWKRDHLK
jgi:hypothetical protein